MNFFSLSLIIELRTNKRKLHFFEKKITGYKNWEKTKEIAKFPFLILWNLKAVVEDVVVSHCRSECETLFAPSSGGRRETEKVSVFERFLALWLYLSLFFCVCAYIFLFLCPSSFYKLRKRNCMLKSLCDPRADRGRLQQIFLMDATSHAERNARNAWSTWAPGCVVPGCVNIGDGCERGVPWMQSQCAMDALTMSVVPTWVYAVLHSPRYMCAPRLRTWRFCLSWLLYFL